MPHRILLFVLVALWTACAPSDPLKRIYSEVENHSRAYASLRECIDRTGHRLTGTENGKEAEETAFQILRSYGLDTVTYLPFTVTSWQRRTLQTKVLGPDTSDIASVCLAYSPVRYEGTAELVDVKEGYASDYDSTHASVRGKFVLVSLGGKENSQNPHRTEKVEIARRHGAEGVVFVNPVEGGVLLTGTASNTSSLIDVPAVCISLEDGTRLKERLRLGTPVRLHISMKNYAGDITARNVVAEWTGTDKPDEVIVIGGHLDSWDLAEGAIDNGIGSFTVMDVARTLAALNLRTRRTIRFVMFMGEEEGLLGSKALVNHYRTTGELDYIKYMLNLDMHGNTIGVNTGGRIESNAFFEKVGRTIRAFDTSYYNRINPEAWIHSDHESFMMEGIPTANFVSNLNPHVYRFYHSSGDRFELVDEWHMKNAVRRVSFILYELANADTLPAMRMDDEETRKFFIRQNLREPLELGKKWKWKD